MKSSAKGKPPDHIQKKEDHLAPTGIKQNNNPANDHEPGANLTHGELQHRLDLYSRIGGNMDQYFKVQAIKQKYLEEIKEKEVILSTSIYIKSTGSICNFFLSVRHVRNQIPVAAIFQRLDGELNVFNHRVVSPK